jgi:hypothetical protein
MPEQTLENRLTEIERKANELEMQNALLDEQTQAFLEEHHVTPKQLTEFISSPENFTPSNWETLQQEKKKREEALTRELHNIVSPAKNKKSLKALHLPSYALFVK